MRKRAVAVYALSLGGFLPFASLPTQAQGIALVQHAAKDNGSASTSSVVVTLNGVGAGHLLTCSITYGNPGGTTLSISDNANGSWSVAGSVHFSTGISQTTALFYLANSKAGTTTITGKPGSAGDYGAMDCQEWSGVATSSPLDQFAEQDGTTANPSSGSVTTIAAGELILGDLENGYSPSAGSGFSLINTDTSPGTGSGLNTEYQIQGSAGTVAATWTLAVTSWTAQVATFKAAPPSAQGIALVQHAAKDNGSASTSSVVVTLNGVGAGHLLTCSITYGNPGGTTLSISDNANGSWSVAGSVHFSTGISQTTALFYLANSKAGTTTITGKPGSAGDYGAMDCQEWSGVATSSPLDQFAEQDGTTANPSSGSVTTIAAGELILGDLENGYSPSAGSGFSLINTDTSPGTGSGLDTEYQIQGSAGSIAATWKLAVTSWTAQVATFKATIGTGGVSPPSISGLSPASGPPGTAVTITGTNFGTTQGTSIVTFNGMAVTPTSWSTTRLVAPVPGGATTGNVVVTVGGVASNGVSFTVTAAGPTISGLSQNSGPVGTFITITGSNFGASQGSSTVTFNGAAGSPLGWGAASIVVPVPSGATTGPIVVSVSSLASNGANFTVVPLQLPTQAQVLAAIENVNNYWIANNKPGNGDWDQATYFTGDLAAYGATGQANYLSFAESWASQNNYSLIDGNTTTFADYQAAGQVYIRLYQLTNTASDLSGITESISGMVNSTVDNEWTWIDAINMSMPDFVELGSINDDTNYYTKMYALYSYAKYTVGLYDAKTGLWWENATYVNTSDHWSRGNGWVFAAHAKVLSVLPTSDPHYAEYLSTFTTMAQALAACQQPGGYWNSDLTGTDNAGPESSGTSFFLYGFAWGLNNGVLDQSTYLPVVEKAWNFLANTAIQPSGLLGYVQPTVLGSGPPSAASTADFGVGAFLLGAPQVAQLTQ